MTPTNRVSDERLAEKRIDRMLDDLIHCVRSHERSPDKYTADEIMIARRVIKDELIAHRAADAQWIAVSERLPEPHSKVFACADGKTIFAYICRHRHFHEDATEEDVANVTHWMPLPPPPGRDV